MNVHAQELVPITYRIVKTIFLYFLKPNSKYFDKQMYNITVIYEKNSDLYEFQSDMGLREFSFNNLVPGLHFILSRVGLKSAEKNTARSVASLKKKSNPSSAQAESNK